MTAPERPAEPWDVGYLRVGLLVSGGVAAVAALAVGLLTGWAAAVSVLVGAVVVAGFFAVSGAVIAWAGRAGDTFTLPAALGTFLVKVMVLAAVFRALPTDGWLDLRVLGWTVVTGALLWGVVQGRWVWTRQLYYATPPAAPQPAVDERSVAAQPPATDPGSPATRG